jgi:hypothetical protein
MRRHDTADDPAELARLHGRLMLDRQEAEAELDAAEAAALPYEREFWARHEDLKMVLADGCGDLAPYYDRRMWAGVDAHPFRERVRAAKDWVRSVTCDLEAVEKRLSAADRAMAKRPRRQPSLF